MMAKMCIRDRNYDVSTQQQLGDKTRVTLLGDYAHTHGYDVVAYGNTGTQAQPDNDGFLSKTLYGALEHNFTDVWSGFVRGYGYDNRTNYDAYYSPGLPLVDTRKLYSQSWDAGLRYNGELIKSQLISSYSHSKDYNYDPHYGRYDSSATLDEMKQYTVQWANNIIIGHGNIGAGVDWQKQSTAPGTACLLYTSFHITVRGCGGHGAIPHKAIDPVLVAAHITTALQSIVSRNVDPLDVYKRQPRC